MFEPRILSTKEYEKMTHYKTGRWYHYFSKPIPGESIPNTVLRLQKQGLTVKVYNMTTRIRGYYETIILVKKQLNQRGEY